MRKQIAGLFFVGWIIVMLLGLVFFAVTGISRGIREHREEKTAPPGYTIVCDPTHSKFSPIQPNGNPFSIDAVFTSRKDAIHRAWKHERMMIRINSLKWPEEEHPGQDWGVCE